MSAKRPSTVASLVINGADATTVSCITYPFNLYNLTHAHLLFLFGTFSAISYLKLKFYLTVALIIEQQDLSDIAQQNTDNRHTQL